MQTGLTATFADGEYALYLKLPQVMELERGCGSIIAIEERLRAGIGLHADGQASFTGGGTASVKEILETIRLALIGGNEAVVMSEQREVGPVEAKRLVDAYCFPARPLAESAVLAWSILNAALRGVEMRKKPQPESPANPKRSTKAR